MPGRGIISSLRAGPPAGAFLFAFLQKPFRGTGWGLRAPTPAPTLSGKSRQKAAARRLRQKPLNAGLGRGDAQSAYFGRGLGLPLRVGLSGVRPNPRAKPAGVFACACYCRCWERRSGVGNFVLRLRLGRMGALGCVVSPCGREYEKAAYRISCLENRCAAFKYERFARRGSRGLPLVVSRGLRGVQRGLRGEIEIPPGPSGPSGAGRLPLKLHRPHYAHAPQSAKENAPPPGRRSPRGRARAPKRKRKRA